jgi:dolichyl-phosphooligosaccharide-protein glycotransferase
MKKCFLIGIPLLVVLWLSIYYRSYPIFFPQFRQQAEDIVEGQIRRDIASDINRKFPGLGERSKAKLFVAAVNDYNKADKAEKKRRIEEEFARLKDPFQDRNGQTYFMELDCWHWARYVENIQRFGHVGDTVKNGKQRDTFMLFPQGTEVPWDTFFYYLSWFFYIIFSWFSAVGLQQFLFYLPLFFCGVYITILYLFCYRNLGNTAAFIACLVAGLAPIFIPRSCAGWFDRDILSLLFPLLVIWAYLEAYRAASWRKTVFCTVIAAFWLGLFAFTWVGWPFILFIIVVFEALYIANLIAEALQYKKDIRLSLFKHLLVPAVFIIVGLSWIILFCGTGAVDSLYARFKEAIHLNQAVTTSIWPNVLSTVGELKKADYPSTARSVGGIFIFLVSLVSLLLVFLKFKQYKPAQRDLVLMLIVWFIVMFFFSAQGIRFTMFLPLPLGIFLGWAIEQLYQIAWSKPYKLITVPVITFLTLTLLLTLTSNASLSASGCLPLMDDNWYQTLTTIKNHTPAGSVINSWWDFGDWFKTVAARPVIFDGQTQNTPQGYWMARTILTDSEKEAVGILRMLNNGGNTAFDTINRHLKNPFSSVALLKRLIVMDSREGSALLNSVLPADSALKVARILYDKPRQKAFFIVDSSMVGKIYAISFLGTWDFSKVYLAGALRVLPKEKLTRELSIFGINPEQAEKLYEEAIMVPPSLYDSWISQRFVIPSIVTQRKTQEDIVMFNNGIIYNPHRKTLYSYSAHESLYRVPRSMFFTKGDTIQELPYENSTLNESAMLLENNDEYKLILLSQPLGRSMFVRMYFLNGKGLSHFKLFSEEGGAGENRIVVYEVLWD